MVRNKPDLDYNYLINFKAQYVHRDIDIDPWCGKLKDGVKDSSGRHMIYYSLFFILVGYHEQTMASQYYCKDCKTVHFKDISFFDFLISFRYAFKPQTHEIIEQIANEEYL